MRRSIRCFCVIFIFLSTRAYAQDIPSPEAFLGGPLGSRFTPHERIVAYCKRVAEAAPGRVKLEQYGETYEGRPLLLLYIASPANLQRLEEIRVNNLRLAGIVRDGIAPDEQTPAIVWLSYNVHGNEPSSSEAAMQTLYTLAAGTDSAAVLWLQHTIVIIDPCLNPDGRERYVNWYRMVAGAEPNPDPQSREHHEPWPGGRSNHYNFDLNRDWAWQTQLETQERMKKYNAWLPQVHVDFHEQGYNDPYYFAPAAEPYHDVITPWQREFQVMIGKNNAKYFDQRGWLYFTRERFDLFYPSYGDTYPLYNGAIGMTFEQAGHSAGGLSVITADEDTLTLADRISHHYTAGLSVIELASQQSARLISEFRKYFTDARMRPAGQFQEWIVKTDPDGDRLDRLKALLAQNGIEWAAATPGTYSGVDYQTDRPAPFQADAKDIVISASQPRSNLLRVLFERNARISDSVTYDITAWSLPFVFGLTTYGMTLHTLSATKTGSENAGSRIAEKPKSAVLSEPSPSSYGYVIRWTGFNSARFLAELLKHGVKIRFADQAFHVGGQAFDKGSLIILSSAGGNLGENLDSLLRRASRHTSTVVWPVASGFVEKGADFGSGHVRLIHRPRVALLTGPQANSLAAGEVWHFFEQELDYPVSLINAEDINETDWKAYDVLIVPDGEYTWPGDRTASESIKSWVRQGGRLIVLGDAVAQLAKGEWGIRSKSIADDKEDASPQKREDDYSALRRYGDRERNEVMGTVPGAIYEVDLDTTHPLAFGYPGHYYTLKQDDRVYEFLSQGGWNVGVIKKENYVSGFAGSKAKEKLKNGLIFGVADLGKGEIVYMADDPLFRAFWENGKLLFCNALFFVGQ